MTKKPPQKTYYLYGKHACSAALANPARQIHKIYITQENVNIIQDYSNKKYEIINVKGFAKFLPQDAVHQGIALLVSPLPNHNLDTLPTQANSTIVILDQITDPHNLGAILRSAAAFGISAIIIPQDNSPPESAIVAKTASGALELIPICRVVNITTTIKLLKKQNFWVIGLDGATSNTLNREALSGKICLILGAEGKGLRRLTIENCDFVAKIPIMPHIESLNVGTAAAIAFYEASIAQGILHDKN